MSAFEFSMPAAQRSLTHIRWIAALVLIVASGGLAAGQFSQAEPPKVSITPRALRSRTPSARPNLRFDVTQVLVPVTVLDATDHPVTNLPLDSFRVFEDNVEQKIVSFFREEGPVSV